MNKSRKQLFIYKPQAICRDRRLTPRQADYLCLIGQLQNNGGCTASNRFFADYFGVSRATVTEMLNQLENKKFIRKSDEKSGGKTVKRTIHIMDSNSQNSLLFNGRQQLPSNGKQRLPSNGRKQPRLMAGNTDHPMVGNNDDNGRQHLPSNGRQHPYHRTKKEQTHNIMDVCVFENLPVELKTLREDFSTAESWTEFAELCGNNPGAMVRSLEWAKSQNPENLVGFLLHAVRTGSIPKSFLSKKSRKEKTVERERERILAECEPWIRNAPAEEISRRWNSLGYLVHQLVRELRPELFPTEKQPQPGAI